MVDKSQVNKELFIGGCSRLDIEVDADKLPRELYKSLTWDRGKEMADRQRFSLDTDVKVYFCDP